MEVESAIDVSKYSRLGPACKIGKLRSQLREGFNSFISPCTICLSYQGNTQPAEFFHTGVEASSHKVPFIQSGSSLPSGLRVGDSLICSAGPVGRIRSSPWLCSKYYHYY